MGGKALKNVITKRLLKEEYNQIKNKIASILAPHLQITFLNELPEKEDFGDLDILYIPNEKIVINDLVVQLFNPKEMVKNGIVLSFSYLINENDSTPIHFQIDLIKSQNIAMDLFYFSYGDLGGILGRITKYYGLTFGNASLYINVEKATINLYLEQHNKKNVHISNVNKPIILSENPEEICVYLGLDYKKWNNGFANNLEIYEFIIKCKFFNPKLFDVENFTLNHEHMRRYKQRTMYKDFVHYIQHNFKENNVKDEIKDRNFQYESLVAFNKLNVLEEVINNNILQNKRKEKFNGHNIMHILQISEKELGTIIPNFKKYIIEKREFNNFEDYIDTYNEEYINNDIINYFYKELNKEVSYLHI